MKKREIFNKYNEIDTRIGRGSGLISIIQYWTINPTQLLLQSSALQVGLWALDNTTFLGIIIHTKWISYWMLLLAIPIKDYMMKLINYLLGEWDEKKLKLWKAQNEYTQTREHMSPFNDYLKKTIENVCEKVGAESEFPKS